MIRIFISYRRKDSRDIAARIYDRLAGEFGRKNVFKDVYSIDLGDDFREAIAKSVNQSTVFLAVIGDQWLNIQNGHGGRRLDDPDDFVRIEIESALRRKIRVIPVLVKEAGMPEEAELPAVIGEMAYRHATRIRDDSAFHRDVDELIRSELPDCEPQHEPLAPSLRSLLDGLARRNYRDAETGAARAERRFDRAAER